MNPPRITSESYARRYRRKMEEQGLVQVSAWIPAHAAPDFYVIATTLRLDPDLAFGSLRHVPTGRLRKI